MVSYGDVNAAVDSGRIGKQQESPIPSGHNVSKHYWQHTQEIIEIKSQSIKMAVLLTSGLLVFSRELEPWTFLTNNIQLLFANLSKAPQPIISVIIGCQSNM